MPTWPTTVPWTADINTIEEVDKDVLVRDTPAVGLEKLRERTTMVIATIKFQRTMAFTAWDALTQFYRGDCVNGSLAFTTNHPRTKAAITAIFNTMPTMKSTDSYLLCIVSLDLSVLPTGAV